MSNPLSSDKTRILNRRLDNLQHNLLSLETTLTNACKLKTISEKVFKKRVVVVNHLRSQIIHLRRTLQENNKDENSVHDFGLPLLNNCTYEELSIIDRILSERLEVANGALRVMKTVYKWIEASAQGKGVSFTAIFKLSRLKKMLLNVEKQLMVQDVDAKNLHKLRSHLVSFMKKQKMQNHEDIEPLIHLFKELDTLTSQIARLKSIIDQQEREIGACERWLLENERMAIRRDSESAPSDEEFLHAHEQVEGPDYNLVRKAQERIEYAKRYVESCLGSDQVTPVRGASAPKDRFDAF